MSGGRPATGSGCGSSPRPARRGGRARVVAVGVLRVGAAAFAALMMAAGDSADHAHEMFDASVADRVRRRRRSWRPCWRWPSAMLLARRLARPHRARSRTPPRRIADGDLGARVPEEGPAELRDARRRVQRDGRPARRAGARSGASSSSTPRTSCGRRSPTSRATSRRCATACCRRTPRRSTRCARRSTGSRGSPRRWTCWPAPRIERGVAGGASTSAATRAASASTSSAPVARPAVDRARAVDAGAGLVVRARSDELTQVLANLLQNAVRYTPPGGEVRVRRRPRSDDGAGCRSRTPARDPARGPAAGLGALLPRREVARPRARRRRHRARDRAPARRGRGRPRRRLVGGRLDDVLAARCPRAPDAHRVIEPSPPSATMRPMSILGDIGGGLLALLYDYRYLAMALGAAAVIGVLLLARRYHWASIARRHPVAERASAAVVALVVVRARRRGTSCRRSGSGPSSSSRRSPPRAPSVPPRPRPTATPAAIRGAVRSRRADAGARADAHAVGRRRAALRRVPAAPTTSTSAGARRRSSRRRPASGPSGSTTSASATGPTCSSTSRRRSATTRTVRSRSRSSRHTDGSFNVRLPDGADRHGHAQRPHLAASSSRTCSRGRRSRADGGLESARSLRPDRSSRRDA